MKLLFNPISGGKDKDTFIKNAEAFCNKYGSNWEYFYTTGENDTDKLKLAMVDISPDRVVSIGGDGTSLMTSLALQGTHTPFGIIPMGFADGMGKRAKHTSLSHACF